MRLSTWPIPASLHRSRAASPASNRYKRQEDGMHVFAVWAPRARTMEVKVGDKRFALAQRERGWWSAEVQEAGPGTDYGFVIDGLEPPLPDPRTHWQPYGVH